MKLKRIPSVKYAGALSAYRIITRKHFYLKKSAVAISYGPKMKGKEKEEKQK